VTCPDCDYCIEIGSPRHPVSLKDHLRQQGFFVNLKPWAELDQDTRDILDAAHETVKEIATWPSWKLGRCNCPAYPTAPVE
jgi:hypothetical protein